MVIHIFSEKFYPINTFANNMIKTLRKKWGFKFRRSRHEFVFKFIDRVSHSANGGWITRLI
jgi:hypothetical protein